MTILAGVVTLVYPGGGCEEGETAGGGGGGEDGGGEDGGGEDGGGEDGGGEDDGGGAAAAPLGGTVTVSVVAGGVPDPELAGSLGAGGPVIASIAVYPATVEETPMPKSTAIFFKSFPQAALLTIAASFFGPR